MAGLSLFDSRKLVVLALGSLLALSACAPKDDQLNARRNSGGGNNSGGNGGGAVETTSLDDRQAELARHVIAQLSDVRRMMNQALALKERVEKLGPKNNKSSELSCRALNKISPAEGKVSFTEKFEIFYDKCPDSSAADKVITATKLGAEKYFVSYAQPIPKKEDGEKVYPLPVSLVITTGGKGLSTELVSTDVRDKVRLDTGLTFTADLVSQDDVNDTATYSVSVEVQNQIDYNIFATRRLGRIKRELSSIQVTVSRTSRQIESMKTGKMNLFVDIQEWDKINLKGEKSPGGKSLENNRILKTQLEVSVVGDLTIPASVCSPVEGTFKVAKVPGKGEEASEPMNVTVSANKVSAQSADKSIDKSIDLQLCNDMQDPLFAIEFGAAYL